MSETPSNSTLVAAQDYEQNVATTTTGPFASILLEHANPQPGERVVDVACGTGVAARLAAPRVGATGVVVGVDVNPAMLAVASALPAPEGPTIDWCEGNASALPLPDHSFDLALCVAGLQFFPDRLQALQEMHRLLGTGGRVALCVWRSIEHYPAQRLIWGAIARYLNTTISAITPAYSLGDAGELRTLMESADFVDVEIVVRSCIVREPVTTDVVSRHLAAMPAIANMTTGELAALAEAVESEIGPALQGFVEGDRRLYPYSAHVALGRKR